MIPKLIHYCWFGKSKMSSLEKECLSSWKKHCPDYEFKIWNEDNFNVNFCEFSKEAYMLGKYAFVSDVARLYALFHEGGIYLDTDILLIKCLDKLLDLKVFLGFESEDIINAAVIGAEKENPYIGRILSFYETKTFRLDSKLTIPQVIASVQATNEVTFLPNHVFYPLPFEFKHYDYREFIKKETLAVHLWNHSWKDKYSYLRENKFFKAFYLALLEISDVLSGLIPKRQYLKFYKMFFRKLIFLWLRF
jgi:mannosyltransferase OCH1-like enzyme